MKGLWHGLHWLFRPYSYFESSPSPSWWAPLPGLGRVLVTGDPGLVQQVAVHPQLVGGRAHRALRAALGSDHLIVLWGEAHRQRRSLIQEVLQDFPEDRVMAAIMREELAQLPLGKSSCLHAVGQRASLRIALRALFGELESRHESHLLYLSRQFLEAFANPLPLFVPALQTRWGPWGRLLQRRLQLRQALLDSLPRCQQGMALQLQARLSPSSLADELLAMLMFGHETTAASYAWSVTHALQFPGWLDPPGGELALVQESLRVSPAVGQLTRVAQSEVTLGEWRVPAGGVVMVALPRLHSQLAPRQQFDPQRFLSGTPSPSHYCPFGIGQRLCPGRPMALRQLAVMLRTTLREFDFRGSPSASPRRHLFLVLPAGGARATRWG